MNQLIKSFFIVCCAIVSGCASFGDLEAGLNSLVGKPVDTAVHIFGYPDSRVPYEDKTIMVWGSRGIGAYSVPQTAYSTGYVGNYAYYGQTQYNQTVYYEQKCEIKLICDSENTILTWQYKGNLAGCNPYISSITEYQNQLKAGERQQCTNECQMLVKNGSLATDETAESCIVKMCNGGGTFLDNLFTSETKGSTRKIGSQ